MTAVGRSHTLRLPCHAIDPLDRGRSNVHFGHWRLSSLSPSQRFVHTERDTDTVSSPLLYAEHSDARYHRSPLAISTHHSTSCRHILSLLCFNLQGVDPAMSTSEVFLVYGGQEVPITLSPSITFSSLLQQAYELWGLKPDHSTPHHLSTTSGASLEGAGAVNVIAYMRSQKEPRLVFGPKKPTTARVLVAEASPQPQQSSDDSGEEDGEDEEDDDDEEAGGTDKENLPSSARPVTPSDKLAVTASSSSLPLPPSAAPIQSQLWRVFAHYCLMAVKASSGAAAAASCPFESLTSSHWVKLLEDCQVIATAAASSPSSPSPSPASTSAVPQPSFSRHQADLLHLTLSKKGGGRFSFSSFLVALSKVASTCFRFSSDPSDLLRSLLTRHVLPLAGRYNPLEHAPLLHNAQLKALMASFSAYHSAVLAAYSAGSGHLSYAQFAQWAAEARLAKLIPPADIGRCFLAAVAEGDGAAWWTGPGKLRVDAVGFSQCIGRLLTQGMSRKAPLNAYTMKAFYQHCHAHPPPRLLKAQPAERKLLERMTKALDAAFAPMWKADGKRDYLAAGAQVRANVAVEARETAYSRVDWAALMDEDAVWSSVERTLKLEAEKQAEAVEGKRQRLSVGSAGKPRVRPAAVKTTASSQGSGKKSAAAAALKSAQAARDEMDFGSPKPNAVPSVMALVPRTPAAKKAPSATAGGESDEDSGNEVDQEEDKRRAAAIVSAASVAVVDERVTREQKEREREAAVQAEQAARVEKELRWQRQKEAELAEVREQERLERGHQEETMQREIVALREQLALQQHAVAAQHQPPKTPVAAAHPPAAASHDEAEESESDGEDEVNTTVIERGHPEQTPSRAVFHPSPLSPSQSQSHSVTAGSFFSPATPSTVIPSSPPVREERPPHTASLPAKQAMQKEGDETDSGQRAVAAGEERLRAEAAHRLVFNDSLSHANDSDDDDEDLSDADDAAPVPASFASFNAAEADDGADDVDEDEDDAGPFTVAINCSYSVNQSLADSRNDPVSADDADDDEDGASHTGALVAVESSLTALSTPRALISHSRPDYASPSSPSPDLMDDGDEERTVQIHQPSTATLHHSHSQTHWLAADPFTTQQRPVQEAEGDDGAEEEDDVVAVTEFDEAAHAERVRLLQVELKERVEARRRLLRRASYMEEAEEKRMRQEMRSKQAALQQLRLLRAKQEHERTRAQLDQAAEARAADVATQAAAEAHATRQRQAAEDAARARRQSDERRAACGVTADAALLAKQKAAQWESLVRSVERGDSFCRWYDRWWIKPKPKFLRVSMVGTAKLWWGPDMFHQDKHIDLGHVVDVKAGSESAIANRLPLDGLACAFSILTHDKAIHLVAASHATREVWMRFFTRYIQQSGECAATVPAAQAQRKSGPALSLSLMLGRKSASQVVEARKSSGKPNIGMTM